MAHSARIVFLFLMSLVLAACGSSGGSSATQTPSEPVDMVGLEAPAHGATLLNKDFALTWKASESQEETRWGVTIYTTVNGTKQTVLTLATTARSYRPLQLGDNTTYTWKVEALNDEGETVAVSDEWTFHTYPTRMLPFAGALDQGSYPDEFTYFRGAVYFTAYSPEYGRELWKKEGASAAEQVEDIRVGDLGSGPQELTVCSDRLYFTADDGKRGRELWVMVPDESPQVKMVKDLVPAEGDENNGSDPSHLSVVNDALYFSAKGSEDAEKTLWWLTGGGGEPDEVIWGSESETLFYPEVGVGYKGCLYVSAFSESAGRELWRVAGNVGTLLEINEGGAPSDPKEFLHYNDKLFFRAATEGHGSELWVVEGEEGGPFLFKEIAPGLESSAPGELTVSGETLFFAATTPDHGRELWKSNGTISGTDRVKDIMEGSKGSQPTGLTDSGGTLYFTAKTAGEGFELWKSDGTEAGTSLIKDIWPGEAGCSVSEMVPFDGGVLFRAEEGDAGKELWYSGGEVGNTFRVKDIKVGEMGSYPESLATRDETLMFRADDGVGGVELWKSDGTEGGTQRTDNINSYLDPDVGGAVRVGDKVVMVGTSGEYGRELFTIDANGHVSVLYDIYAGYQGSNPDNLFVHGDHLYFGAEDAEKGRELWISDGTLGGTGPLKDVNPDGDGNPCCFTAFNNKVFFLAQREDQWQLWETDGTQTGTVQVEDQSDLPVEWPVSSPAYQPALAAGDARLFFRKGDELWARDINGSIDKIAGVSKPSHLFPVAKSLLFSVEGDGLRFLPPEKLEPEAALQCDSRGLFESRDFYRAGDAVFFSAMLEGGTERHLFRFSISDSTVSLMSDPGGTPLLGPEELCGDEGLLWFLAGPSGSREIWQVQAGADTARRLASVASRVVAGAPSSLRPVGDVLYFIATHPSERKPTLYMYRGSTIGPVLDFNNRPLFDAKNLFSLDGFLFLTAVNPDTTLTQPTQGLWVTSPCFYQ